MSIHARLVAGSEVAPMPRMFGAQAVRVAALLRIHADAPKLATRLCLSPVRAVHAVAAFLEAEAGAGTPLEAMAEAIMSSDPRTLLGRALPSHDPRLFRVLDRVPLPAWGLVQLVALDEVIRSDVGDVLKRGAITHATVAQARHLMRAHPVVRRVRGRIFDAGTRQRLTATLIWLQQQGALQHLAAIPEGAGAASVAWRLRDDLAVMQAPKCPFAVPEGWVHVGTPEALWAVGRSMMNCLVPGSWGSAATLLGLLDGSEVFLWHQDGMLLAHLRRCGSRVWSLVALLGARNQQAPESKRQMLVGTLKRSGVVILDVELEAALDALLAPLRGSGIESAEDPVDMVDDARSSSTSVTLPSSEGARSEPS